jgi:transcriptional regulator with XRE-family HTH domain
VSDHLDVSHGSPHKARSTGVGAEIRAARTALGLSTRELAKRIGTSQPFVSNIENGRIFPSLRTVELLAVALETEADTLLPANERAERISGTVGMRIRRSGEIASRRLLGAPDRGLQAYRVELHPGESEPRPFAHDGEDFVFMLDGELSVLREGMPAARLARGDAIWLDGSIPHRLSADSDASSPGIALITVAANGGDAHSA